jgi:hypothetical protein
MTAWSVTLPREGLLSHLHLRPMALPVAIALILGLLRQFLPFLAAVLTGIGALWIFILSALWMKAIIGSVHISTGRQIACRLALIPAIWFCADWTLSVGDYGHLALMYPNYAVKIAANHGALTSFNWGSGGAFLVGVQRVLVYDSDGRISDKTAYPNFATTASSASVSHLFGHFYVVDDDM